MPRPCRSNSNNSTLSDSANDPWFSHQSQSSSFSHLILRFKRARKYRLTAAYPQDQTLHYFFFNSKTLFQACKGTISICWLTKTFKEPVSLLRSEFHFAVNRFAFVILTVVGTSTCINVTLSIFLRRQNNSAALTITRSPFHSHVTFSAAEIARIQNGDFTCTSEGLYDLRLKMTVFHNLKSILLQKCCAKQW